MSQNNPNSENTAVIMAVAFIGAGMMVFAFFIAMILAFLAFVFTIGALFAWNKPLQIGNQLIMPQDARDFVYRGLIGGGGVPTFLFFCDVVFGLNIEWDYFFYYALFGYVGGSIGIDFLTGDDAVNESPVHPQQMQQVLPPQPVQQALPSPPRAPFRYASWDDEEENRR